MRTVLAFLLLFSGTVFAYTDDPHQQFSMTNNETNSFKVTFRQTDDIEKACSAESRNRGFDGFPYKVNACSFWNHNYTECVVITKKTASLQTLGHEIRHCLQGNYHK